MTITEFFIVYLFDEINISRCHKTLIGNGGTKSWFVINEVDTVFRKQSTFEDSNKATRSSAVNQILPKFDVVNTIPNDLLIGMTNRQELLDDALLRPGRLEVQKYITLHNVQGRYMGCLISLIMESWTISDDDTICIVKGGIAIPD